MGQDHVLRVKQPANYDYAGLIDTSRASGNAPLRQDAFKLGERQGMVEAAREHISDPIARLRAETAILAAPTTEAAHEAVRKILDDQIAAHDAERSKIKVKIEWLQRAGVAAEDLQGWIAGDLQMSSATESRVHEVCAQNFLSPTHEVHEIPVEIIEAQAAGCPSFLVQHEWGRVFLTADIDDGGYRLPYDRCSFDFLIGGRHICAVIASEDGVPFRLFPLVRAKGGWFLPRTYRLEGETILEECAEPEGTIEPLVKIIMQNVRAIAIMLDAEVVVSEAVRKPHEGAPRRLRNDLGGYAHHILRLSRRNRLSAAPGSETGHHKRLHFRRGHWRHFSAHKTWVRWCLVGNAELGFADKDYRL